MVARRLSHPARVRELKWAEHGNHVQMLTSHPAGVRELKRSGLVRLSHNRSSHPTRGAGVEKDIGGEDDTMRCIPCGNGS